MSDELQDLIDIVNQIDEKDKIDKNPFAKVPRDTIEEVLCIIEQSQISIKS